MTRRSNNLLNKKIGNVIHELGVLGDCNAKRRV